MTMTITTGAVLRRIIETQLSASAHKLATVILDGIAWKDRAIAFALRAA